MKCENILYLTDKEIHRISLAIKINRIRPQHKIPFGNMEFHICPFKTKYGECTIANIKPTWCKTELKEELTTSQAMHLSNCRVINAREFFFNERCGH